MSPKGGDRGRSDAGLHERPAADLAGAAGLQLLAADKSTWAAVKGFKDNIELEVAATYASSGTPRLDTVADSRGATINVHYSISMLPQTGYQPRLADDRVGYFLTVVKDYSSKSDRRPLRPLHQSLGPAEGRSLGRALAAEEADRLLARKDHSVQVSQADPRRHSANGTRPSRRPASPTRSKSASSPTTPTGIRKTSTTTRSAGSPSSAGFAMGPCRVNPLHRPDSRRRHHLRRRLPARSGSRSTKRSRPRAIAAMTGGARHRHCEARCRGRIFARTAMHGIAMLPAATTA